MKKILFSFTLLITLAAGAQENKEIQPAAKGVVYGNALSANTRAVNVNDLQQKMAGNAFEGQVTGRVKEVCKEMGCWMKLEKADGTTLMVKTKDHAYFMPQNIVSKTVVIEGAAKGTTVTEEQRKHLAADAGKGKEEINKIKGAQKQVQFIASGVQVVD